MNVNAALNGTPGSAEYNAAVYAQGLYSGLTTMEGHLGSVGVSDALMRAILESEEFEGQVGALLDRAAEGEDFRAESKVEYCAETPPPTHLTFDGLDGFTAESSPGIKARGNSGQIALEVKPFTDEQFADVVAEAREIIGLLQVLIRDAA